MNLTASEVLEHYLESQPLVALVFGDGETFERELDGAHPLDVLPLAALPDLVAVVVVCTGESRRIDEDGDPVRTRIVACMTRHGSSSVILNEGQAPYWTDDHQGGAVGDAMSVVLGIAA